MKKHHKIFALLFSVMLMTSCTDNNNNNPVTSEISNENEVVTENTKKEELCMPLLSIQTKSQDENVMDFVTKPVTGFVSASIATWTPGYVIPPEPYYEECTITLTDTNGTVLLNNADASVKVRGNWTTNYQKKPLRIKFNEKQNVLGMNEMRNWVLLAEYKDISMLRNKTALYISRKILEKDNLYASDSQLTEVVINGEYWGVYLLAEYQQISSSRVDIASCEENYTGTDIGYFLEFDGNFENEDELQNFAVDFAENAALIPFDGNGGSGKTIKCLPVSANDYKKEVGMTIKSDINSEEQHDFIASYINNVYNIMYSAAYDKKAFVFNDTYTEISENNDITPEEAVRRVVNVDSLADMYIISELTCDADIYWSSFYMDVDFSVTGEKKLRFEAPWDFDSALGNKNRCVDGKGFYAANIVPDVNDAEYMTINPWLAVLMYEDWFQNIIKDKWTSAYDDGVFESAFKMIEEDTVNYADAFKKNYERWNNLSDKSEFENELSSESLACRTFEDASDYLLKWIKSRVDFMNSYWHKII